MMTDDTADYTVKDGQKMQDVCVGVMEGKKKRTGSLSMKATSDTKER